MKQAPRKDPPGKDALGKDVLGHAIADYAAGNRRRKLWVHMQTAAAAASPDSISAPRPAANIRVPASSHPRTLPREEMPIKTYFRTAEQMPELEWIALQHCRGRILDIGAGAGSHSLALQQLGQDVTALEISPLAAAVIKTRGVRKVLCKNFFALTHTRRYDTLLLLMNGIGIAGNLIRLRAFLRQARALSRPGAALLFDSCDISYLYPKTPASPPYYGELIYQYEYRKQRSDPFPWLFIDRKTLKKIAAEEGWQTTILHEDDNDQYLARCH